MQKPVSKEGFFPQLPVSQKAVDLFNFSSERISQRNFLFFQEYQEFRISAYHINIKRSFDKADNKEVHYAKPSDLNAAALINAIYKKVLDSFETSIAPDFRKNLVRNLEQQVGNKKIDALSELIESIFPYDIEIERQPKVADLIIRSLVIRLNNENPALQPYNDLFSDKKLIENKDYKQLMRILEPIVQGQGKPSSSSLTLLDFLREPFKRFPNSLYDQLAFIKKNWSPFLGDFLDNLLLALDFLKEENKPVFTGFGPPESPDLGLLNDEYEAFTDDSAWMPNVIMLAKSTLVWLDQLSKKYKRPIQHLDQIPNKELDTIRKSGFNSLWLIGIWERSKASKRIKHIYGNPDAEASAYSLYDYDIADSLGGWKALQKLRKQCEKRDIRLASDMVPNHTAIDSRWVVEHPDWFLQLPENPMPFYTYNGEDLCHRDDIGVYLEDKYYSKEDCAVVFKRVNHNTGKERYIYHGNDGTGLPWNDTAQLDYLNPEAREAIIQTILHVARNFKIIRFDAAMTLAKKHIQRLWYPAPGQGGDISTRAEHALSTADFNKAIPKEFWREVVDRIAVEAPDTLLLAEAFWMLEGYFVRTLGMHRVYNSAFMHMLRDEDNDKYRHLIKETLEFDPQILKRYVNFMNNPDEETAAEQFGKGDKYFGICMLLCTLPGLPMIGHGQVEGFSEKYGMEFKAAQWDEKPDEYLVKRHQEEIFPLMHKRYLFSEVKHFRLYHFMDDNNHLNENVFAYSNQAGKENVLVLYNNCFDSCSGRVYHGVPYKLKADDCIIVPPLSDFIKTVAPKQSNSERKPEYLVFTEFKSGLDYIRPYSEIEELGIYCLLNGYEYQIFENFQAAIDLDGSLSQMSEILNGSGVEDIFFEAKMLKYKQVHQALLSLVNSESIDLLQETYQQSNSTAYLSWLETALVSYKKLCKQATNFPSFQNNAEKSAAKLEKAFQNLSSLLLKTSKIKDSAGTTYLHFLDRELCLSEETLIVLLCWTTLQTLTEFDDQWNQELALVDFAQVVGNQTHRSITQKASSIQAIKILNDCSQKENSIKKLLLVESIREHLKINQWNDVMWFEIKPFEKLLAWIYMDEMLRLSNNNATKRQYIQIQQEYEIRHHALLKSDYKLSNFLANIKG